MINLINKFYLFAKNHELEFKILERFDTQKLSKF